MQLLLTASLKMKAYYINNDYEVSDEGEQAKGIEFQIDYENALKRLTERERAIFKMYSEGYERKEIAKTLKLSISVIDKNIKSAKQKIKIALS